MERRLIIYKLFFVSFLLTISSCSATGSYNFRAVENYEKGILCYNRFEYPEAKKYFSAALEIEPEYKEARKKFHEVMWIIGESDEVYGKRINLIKKKKEELIRDHNEGKQLLAKENYKEAKIKFEQCLERIKWFPYRIDDGTYEKLCNSAIAECDKMLNEGKEK